MFSWPLYTSNIGLFCGLPNGLERVRNAGSTGETEVQDALSGCWVLGAD